MVLHNQPKNNSNSQVVKRKSNFRNQKILLVEAFLVHNSGTKILPDMSFLKNDSPEQYLKNISEKPNDKTFEEIKKFHLGTVPVVNENQNAAKKSGSVTFVSSPYPNLMRNDQKN